MGGRSVVRRRAGQQIFDRSQPALPSSQQGCLNPPQVQHSQLGGAQFGTEGKIILRRTGRTKDLESLQQANLFAGSLLQASNVASEQSPLARLETRFEFSQQRQPGVSDFSASGPRNGFNG